MARREIVKRRIGPEGTDIGCEDDAPKYVDLKETKKARYERGTGPAYQKTVYSHCETSERREYEDPPLRIKNPDDESQFIDYRRGVIKKTWIEAGSGPSYQKTRLTFCNSEENTSRKVRLQTVENEDTGDRIEVERIQRWQNEWGSGPSFSKKRIHPCSTEEDIDAMEGPCKVSS